MENRKGGLNALLIYTLFLPVSIVICTEILMPDRFPFCAVSSLWYMVLFLSLIRYYYECVAGYGQTRRLVIAIAMFMLMSIVLRAMKFSLFYEVDVFRRHLWYMYYIPFLMIPLLMYLAAVSIGGEERILQPWMNRIIILVTVIAILGVLTNDSHGIFFRFKEGFADWDSDYSHGISFYLLMVWEYMLYFLAISVMLRKCRLKGLKSTVRLMLIPVAIANVLIVIIIFELIRINGMELLSVVEVKCYMAAAILGLAIESGMIPAKEKPESLLKSSSLAIEITDKKGKNIYSAQKDDKTSYNCMYADVEEGRAGSEDTIVRRYDLGNWYGFWQEDVSELNRLKEHLTERQDELREEVELSRLENELKDKKLRIMERDRIYDQISAGTEHAVDKIYELAKLAEESDDPDELKNAGKCICFLGAYIKRFSNLYLHAATEGRIRITELGLAVQELLLQLNEMGIACECMADSDIAVPADQAMACYELIGKLLEYRLHELEGVYIRILDGDEIWLKMTLEGTQVEDKEVEKCLGVLTSLSHSILYEDGISYIRVSLGRRNENDPS